jgi:hypothetical protein
MKSGKTEKRRRCAGRCHLQKSAVRYLHLHSIIPLTTSGPSSPPESVRYIVTLLADIFKTRGNAGARA